MKTQLYSNQQLFSDHYLDAILPGRQDWRELAGEAEPVMREVTRLFKRYKPSEKEAQAEHEFIRPVLALLGHTFEVQASLATPDGTKQPDYVFYRDEEALRANKGKQAELLALVEACLSKQAAAEAGAEVVTEQADVVHDLLAHLAERLIDLHTRRQVAVEDFVYDLKAELSDGCAGRAYSAPLDAAQHPTRGRCGSGEAL